MGDHSLDRIEDRRSITSLAPSLGSVTSLASSLVALLGHVASSLTPSLVARLAPVLPQPQSQGGGGPMLGDLWGLKGLIEEGRK